MKTSREMLQEAQNELGLSQKELGIYIGVSARTINSWMGPAESRTCPLYVAEAALRMAQADMAMLEEKAIATGMMRWALINEDNRSEDLHVYGAKADAIRDAEIYWSHMTKAEQERTERFEVGLIHAALTGSGSFSYYEDENGLIDADVYEVAKSWK